MLENIQLWKVKEASCGYSRSETNEKGMLNPGDKIICVGFGGGLTWGATLIEWS